MVSFTAFWFSWYLLIHYGKELINYENAIHRQNTNRIKCDACSAVLITMTVLEDERCTCNPRLYDYDCSLWGFHWKDGDVNVCASKHSAYLHNKLIIVNRITNKQSRKKVLYILWMYSGTYGGEYFGNQRRPTFGFMPEVQQGKGIWVSFFAECQVCGSSHFNSYYFVFLSDLMFFYFISFHYCPVLFFNL